MNLDPRFSRRALLQGGALTIGFTMFGGRTEAQAQGAAATAARTLAPDAVDAYFVMNADGSATLYCGKVDLGQGLRIAIPQMAAEELGIGVDKIKFIEGDTALTPDQGPTAGSTGIMRGGVQVRQAAATARKALIEMAAQKLNVPAADLTAADGMVRPKAGGAGVRFADLLAGKRFDLKLDPKAPLKDPKDYTIVGKPLPRPDVPAKSTGSHVYMQDFSLPGMLHARVIRPASIGATLVSVDESSIKDFAGVKVVRVGNFLGLVGDDEWTVIKAQRVLKAQWSESATLPVQADVPALMRAGPFTRDERLANKGEQSPAIPPEAKTLKATYYWPMQSHASMGPSCAVVDIRADGARVWTASQAPHRLRRIVARLFSLPEDKIRVTYLDGAGCYGMNGHDDAVADAALLSRAVGKPVRVQWTREDEHGWDPKGPPQLIEISGSVDPEGKILDWRTEMWIPEATRGLPNIPLLGPADAGIAQPLGLSTGLISQNGDPPYVAPNMSVLVHWLKDAPLRPSNLRAPGKIANCFAVESFFDEMAAATGRDPVELRLQGLSDPRGIEVVKRTAAMMKWQPRPSPLADTSAAVARGRGIAYVHYKHNETYLAMGMEVAVERATGRIRVERVTCAHDCGLVVNPDGVRSQVEGCILQTLSRALYEEVAFDRSRVTSTDWGSYPILTMSETPKIEIELVARPNDPPLGAGEAATAPVGAALANAVFDATGVRLRTVPFTPERVKAALQNRST